RSNVEPGLPPSAWSDCTLLLPVTSNWILVKFKESDSSGKSYELPAEEYEALEIMMSPSDTLRKASFCNLPPHAMSILVLAVRPDVTPLKSVGDDALAILTICKSLNLTLPTPAPEQLPNVLFALLRSNSPKLKLTS